MPLLRKSKRTGVFDGCDSISDKAARLKEFVKSQQERQTAKAGKVEWLVENRALSARSTALQADMAALLPALQRSGAISNRFLLECSDQLQIAEQLLREEAAACKEAISRARAMTRTFKAHEFRNVAEEVQAVRGELAAASEMERKHVRVLEAEATLLSAELRSQREGIEHDMSQLPMWWLTLSSGTAGSHAKAESAAYEASARSSPAPDNAHMGCAANMLTGEQAPVAWTDDGADRSSESEGQEALPKDEAACDEHSADQGRDRKPRYSGDQKATCSSDGAALTAADRGCTAPRPREAGLHATAILDAEALTLTIEPAPERVSEQELYELVLSEANLDALTLRNRFAIATKQCQAQVQAAFRALHINFYAAVQTLSTQLDHLHKQAPHGWSHEEAIVYNTVIAQAAYREIGTGSRAQLLRDIQKRLPAKSLTEVDAYDRNAECVRLQAAKQRGLHAQWSRQRGALIGECETMLGTDEAVQLEHASFAAQVVEFEVDRERMLDLHESTSQRHAERALLDEQSRALAAAREASVAERQQAEHDARQADNRTKLEAWSSDLQQAASDRAAMAAQAALAERVARSERLRTNAPIVQHRAALYERKVEEKRDRLAAAERENEAREARLERIRSLVEVNVTHDAERILQPTQSQLAESEAVASAFCPLHGYSADRITSDRRFRAAEKMRNQGLHQKAYAKDVLRNMHYEVTPRRLDQLTTEQRHGARAPRFF